MDGSGATGEGSALGFALVFRVVALAHNVHCALLRCPAMPQSGHTHAQGLALVAFFWPHPHIFGTGPAPASAATGAATGVSNSAVWLPGVWSEPLSALAFASLRARTFARDVVDRLRRPAGPRAYLEFETDCFRIRSMFSFAVLGSRDPRGRPLVSSTATYNWTSQSW